MTTFKAFHFLHCTFSKHLVITCDDLNWRCCNSIQVPKEILLGIIFYSYQKECKWQCDTTNMVGLRPQSLNWQLWCSNIYNGASGFRKSYLKERLITNVKTLFSVTFISETRGYWITHITTFWWIDNSRLLAHLKHDSKSRIERLGNLNKNRSRNDLGKCYNTVMHNSDCNILTAMLVLINPFILGFPLLPIRKLEWNTAIESHNKKLLCACMP